MLRPLMIFALALLWPLSVVAETVGPWTLDPPKGAKPSEVNGMFQFESFGSLLILSPVLPTTGPSSEETVNSFIETMSQSMEESNFTPLRTRDWDDGSTVKLRTGTLKDGTTGQTVTLQVMVFERDGQRAVAMAMISNPVAMTEAVKSIQSFEFDPTAAAPPPPASVRPAPKPQPTPGRRPPARQDRPDSVALSPGAGDILPGHPLGGIVSAKTEVDWVAAMALGINPERYLIPDRFYCFETDEKQTIRLNPFGVLTIKPNGRYDFLAGGKSRSGRYTRILDDDGDPRYTFEGPLYSSSYGSFFRYDEFGQSVDPYTGDPRRELTCKQKGAASEAYTLEISREMLQPGTMNCIVADGRITPVTFGNGSYSMGGRRGQFRTVGRLSGNGGTGIESEFTSGPWKGLLGEYAEDKDGNRTLKVYEEKDTSSSMFVISSETTGKAYCTSRGPARSSALYGHRKIEDPDVAAAGIEGVFSAWRWGVVGWYDYGALYGMRTDTLTFYANGHYTDIEPQEYNEVPDCSRSKPNGKPLCEVYEIRNSKIRFRDEEGDWDDWMEFKLTPKGFEVDEKEQYNPIATMDGMKIGGVYTTSDIYSGPGFSAIGPSAGTISYSDTGYVFLENGLFQWRSERSSDTYINSDPMGIVGGGVMGVASNSSSDGGFGTYEVEGNWLILTFTDGRVMRKHIHVKEKGWEPGDGPPRELYIDGSPLPLAEALPGATSFK